MDYEIRYEPDGDYVFVRATGALDGDSAAPLVKRWIELAREHQCLRSVGDLTGTRVTGDVFDMLDFIETRMPDLGVDYRMRIALVAARDLEAHRFFEIANQNRFFNLRVFEDLTEAIAWIRGEPVAQRPGAPSQGTPQPPG